MPYEIEWKSHGAVKKFSGVVTYEDVLRSEQQISGSSNFTNLRYVISDYSGADYQGITENQKVDVNALRIGGHFVNKGIKYAFVLQNPQVAAQMQEAVASGMMLFETRVFERYEQAAQWVGLR